MKIKSVCCVHFSPTGTTRTIAESIVQGIRPECADFFHGITEQVALPSANFCRMRRPKGTWKTFRGRTHVFQHIKAENTGIAYNG